MAWVLSSLGRCFRGFPRHRRTSVGEIDMKNASAVGLSFSSLTVATRSARRCRPPSVTRSRVARYVDWGDAVQRLNARWNALASEKPSRNATSAMAISALAKVARWPGRGADRRPARGEARAVGAAADAATCGGSCAASRRSRPALGTPVERSLRDELPHALRERVARGHPLEQLAHVAFQHGAQPGIRLDQRQRRAVARTERPRWPRRRSGCGARKRRRCSVRSAGGGVAEAHFDRREVRTRSPAAPPRPRPPR